MFRNRILFNFFVKNDFIVKTPTQQLYFIYCIFTKSSNTLTFNQFCSYVYLYKHNFKKTSNLYLFLFYLFFSKTRQIKYIGPNDTLTAASAIYTSTDLNNSKIKISNFWDKFKKLKRPATELSYSDYYISSYQSKLNKYSSAGFLLLLDSFYVVRSKSEVFLKTYIQVNKPLLLTPKYSSSSINKYLSLDSLQNFEFQFLRKNKVFNKGRYSRCRQNYRTGVYMCMYLSVVSIFGLYYWFYKFSFNFTYLW